MKSSLATIIHSNALIVVLAISGCGSEDRRLVDTGPTIFGMSPAQRATMWKLVNEYEPDADADKVVNDYMDELKAYVAKHSIQPNASGEYELTGIEPAKFDESVRQAMSSGEKVYKVVDEFEINLPEWAERAVEKDRTGSLPTDQKEFLWRYVTVRMYLGGEK